MSPLLNSDITLTFPPEVADSDIPPVGGEYRLIDKRRGIDVQILITGRDGREATGTVLRVNPS